MLRCDSREREYSIQKAIVDWLKRVVHTHKCTHANRHTPHDMHFTDANTRTQYRQTLMNVLRKIRSVNDVTATQ